MTAGRTAHLVLGVVGVGVPIAAAAVARSPNAWLLIVAGALVPAAAAVIFWRVPFGRLPVRSAHELPRRWRRLYAMGFLGGAAYFLAATWDLCAAQEQSSYLLAAVSGAVLVLLVPTSLPRWFTPARSVAIVLISPAMLVDPIAVSAIYPGTAWWSSLATVPLLAVGWEALAHRPPASLSTCGCAVAIVTVIWLGVCLAAMGARAGRTTISLETSLIFTALLASYATTNARAIASFIVPGFRWGAPTCLLTALALAAVAVTTHHRLPLLLLPATATLVLYTSFVIRAAREDPARSFS